MHFKSAGAVALAIGALLLPTAAMAQDAETPPPVQLGNGEKNWIIVDGIERSNASTYTEVRATNDAQALRRGDGVTLTIPEVHIEGDGWLVMHPFVGGKPSGTYVAGYTFVESGTNTDVAITLNPAPASGDMYVVMLHKDANEDRVFDFVFVAENVVEDEAVFEGTTMIAHIVAVP
ncbi:hypothetical protein [uncultured Erythrobacter sp.]|uniref:DUF7282 domain-containing protein n=1 Tax=uncultured Erythrobacter sp. TaxID=263913 RepID=UPI00262B66D2|nr:hypothetical protein [uncultured Erythrobacter sp.]